MSSQLHAYIEFFIIIMWHLSCCGLPDRSGGAQGGVPLGLMFSGVTAGGLLIGLTMVGMKRPPLPDRLGTLFLVSLTLHVCTDTTGLIHYFTELTHATARFPRSSTHTHTLPFSHTHMC